LKVGFHRCSPHIKGSKIHQDVPCHRRLFGTIFSSVADPGCLSPIPDPSFFHHGSPIRLKEFRYFNPKKWF
jgi:hypothetical protein